MSRIRVSECWEKGLNYVPPSSSSCSPQEYESILLHQQILFSKAKYQLIGWQKPYHYGVLNIGMDSVVMRAGMGSVERIHKMIVFMFHDLIKKPGWQQATLIYSSTMRSEESSILARSLPMGSKVVFRWYPRSCRSDDMAVLPIAVQLLTPLKPSRMTSTIYCKACFHSCTTNGQ